MLPASAGRGRKIPAATPFRHVCRIEYGLGTMAPRTDVILRERRAVTVHRADDWRDRRIQPRTSEAAGTRLSGLALTM
jgi:hypothetical protein